MAALLTAAMSEDALVTWGWRVAFFIAGPLGLVARYIRRRLDETPLFQAVEAPRRPRLFRDVLRERKARVGRGFVLVAVTLVSVTGSGSFALARLNKPLSFAPKLSGGTAAALRGTIVMALYGHCVAQSPQPMQVFGLMSICPSSKGPIAPVGQPVRHSGSWQCRQTEGARTC